MAIGGINDLRPAPGTGARVGGISPAPGDVPRAPDWLPDA
jgi:hypothetical protein